MTRVCACCGTHEAEDGYVYCGHCQWPGHYCQSCGACRDEHRENCQRHDQVEKRRKLSEQEETEDTESKVGDIITLHDLTINDVTHDMLPARIRAINKETGEMTVLVLAPFEITFSPSDLKESWFGEGSFVFTGDPNSPFSLLPDDRGDVRDEPARTPTDMGSDG